MDKVGGARPRVRMTIPEGKQQYPTFIPSYLIRLNWDCGRTVAGGINLHFIEQVGHCRLSCAGMRRH